MKACFSDVPQPEGVARCSGMTLALGFVAVPRTVPVGDKVALKETASRVLSASLTPRKVFGGGEARRKLARRASLRTCTV